MLDEFVKTKNVKALISLGTKLCSAPKNAPKMGLVYGEPGLGKTRAITWLSVVQDATLITAKNSMTARWILSELVTDLGESPLFYLADLFEQAARLLIEEPRMIIIDEVDYLINDSKAIETIRDLHDRTGVPILLVGMGEVDKKLCRFKHLFDRIVEIYKFKTFDLEDVSIIVKTLSEVKIEDDVIEVISQKANRLRQIVKLIAKIENLAKTNGYKSVTKKDLGW